MIFLKFLLYVWMVLVLLGAFFYAPLAKGLGEYTRVMYFHVPMAWITTLTFLIGAIYSILYLRKKDIRYDYYSETANQLGLLFALLATITGSIWAKMSWGAFWNWDPRETSIFILLLIYAAYFALRSAIEQQDRKAALSAVYDILAFVTVPFFIFIVPRIYSSLHPDPLINTQGKVTMNGKMQLVFFNSLLAFTMVYFWMLKNKLEVIKLKMKLKQLES